MRKMSRVPTDIHSFPNDARTCSFYEPYRVFSRDVTAAMLVYLNNGTAAVLVYPTSPPGIELYYHVNDLFT